MIWLDKKLRCELQEASTDDLKLFLAGIVELGGKVPSLAGLCAAEAKLIESHLKRRDKQAIKKKQHSEGMPKLAEAWSQPITLSPFVTEVLARGITRTLGGHDEDLRIGVTRNEEGRVTLTFTPYYRTVVADSLDDACDRLNQQLLAAKTKVKPSEASMQLAERINRVISTAQACEMRASVRWRKAWYNRREGAVELGRKSKSLPFDKKLSKINGLSTTVATLEAMIVASAQT